MNALQVIKNFLSEESAGRRYWENHEKRADRAASKNPIIGTWKYNNENWTALVKAISANKSLCLMIVDNYLKETHQLLTPQK